MQQINFGSYQLVHQCTWLLILSISFFKPMAKLQHTKITKLRAFFSYIWLNCEYIRRCGQNSICPASFFFGVVLFLFKCSLSLYLSLSSTFCYMFLCSCWLLTAHFFFFFFHFSFSSSFFYELCARINIHNTQRKSCTFVCQYVVRVREGTSIW